MTAHLMFTIGMNIGGSVMLEHPDSRYCEGGHKPGDIYISRPPFYWWYGNGYRPPWMPAWCPPVEEVCPDCLANWAEEERQAMIDWDDYD